MKAENSLKYDLSADSNDVVEQSTMDQFIDTLVASTPMDGDGQLAEGTIFPAMLKTCAKP